MVFLAPEWVNDSMTLLVVEPEVSMDVGLNTHLLVNAYDKDGTLPPIARWAKDGLSRYIEKNKYPTVLARAGLQLPRKALENKPGTVHILTQKNLAVQEDLPGHSPVGLRQHSKRLRARQ